MAIEFRLCDEDRDKHGGPEWVTFDIAGLDDVPFDVLDPLEREMKALWGFGLMRLIAEEMPEETMRAKRALVWLARKLAGVDTPELAKFTVKVGRLGVRAVKPVGDGDPPVVDSSTTSSEEKASAKDSSRSSRGSGKTPATSSQPEKSGS